MYPDYSVTHLPGLYPVRSNGLYLPAQSLRLRLARCARRPHCYGAPQV